MIESMVRETYVSIDGRRTRYLEAGAGWPVVLIHAFPLNADMWRPQLSRPPEGSRLIAPDVRGFGPGSTAAEATPNLTVDDMASDIAALLDHLELERAVIGGLSMGGYITFALFRNAAERFNGMILADTRPQADTPEGREARRKMIDLVHSGGAPAVADQMLPKLLNPSSDPEFTELKSGVRRTIESAAAPSLVAAITAMMERPDSSAELTRISCPTLVLVGENDAITPVADAEAMHERILRSRLVVLPGAGHLSNLQSPAAFSLALADFLASNI
jgi:pimeloyl-ACP methyl ester carboxylesterase